MAHKYENYNDDSEPISSVEILNNCILSNGIKYLMYTTDNDVNRDYITIDNKNIYLFNKKILPTDTNLDLIGYNIPTIETGTNIGFMFFDIVVMPDIKAMQKIFPFFFVPECRHFILNSFHYFILK